jgi:riboflavin transporter FmnP
MKYEELSKLTDQELLNKAKKVKSNPIMTAVLIGFLIGILIYSILVSSIGFFSLIPLYFIFKFFNNSKNDEDLEKLLMERKLK